MAARPGPPGGLGGVRASPVSKWHDHGVDHWARWSRRGLGRPQEWVRQAEISSATSAQDQQPKHVGQRPGSSSDH
ncbi:MAG: hypothetical protein U0836_02920 [Pirellulales bacterium]